MVDGYVPDAVIISQLEKTRADIFQYIQKNIDNIDDNLPVFFGKIAMFLEKASFSIPDQAYDALIDAVIFKVLDSSSQTTNPAHIKRISELASGMKRDKQKTGGIDLAAAVILMKNKKFLEAASYLEPYRSFDVQIGCWHAYCYYALYREGSKEPGYLPSDRWQYQKVARKLMGELSQWAPPCHRLLSGELKNMDWLWEYFWLMIFSALEWLPEERWYLEIGINKAKDDSNEILLARFLQIALVHFPHDMFFYREAYLRNFEEGELDGAISLVREMEKEHPLELEPVYYGLRTSFFIPDNGLFFEFRKSAEEKQMPIHVLQMIDFGYEYLKGRGKQARVCLDEFRQTFPEFGYFTQLLDFIVFQQEHQKKSDRTVVFNAVDNFCMRMLKISTR